MASALEQARLEQELFNHSPALVQSARVLRSFAGIIGNMSPDGRRLAARILLAQASCLEMLAEDPTTSWLAPQIIFIMATAQACRDLAIKAIRYAGVSNGIESVSLTVDGRGALNTIEAADPVRNAPRNFDPTRTCIRLATGVHVSA